RRTCKAMLSIDTSALSSREAHTCPSQPGLGVPGAGKQRNPGIRTVTRNRSGPVAGVRIRGIDSMVALVETVVAAVGGAGRRPMGRVGFGAASGFQVVDGLIAHIRAC